MSKQKAYAAFVAAQKQFAPALKTSQNPHFKSRYADLAACVEAVIDALNSNGLAVIQRPLLDTTGVTFHTVFLHDTGEEIDGGILHLPASKQDAQGYGSAATYCRRYGLMAACGIAPEDDDGNAASQSKSPAKDQAKQQDEAGEPDAEILAQFNAAQDIPSLTKLMNGLPNDKKRLYTGHFNARMGELKKGA
jgi:hypothetical protein